MSDPAFLGPNGFGSRGALGAHATSGVYLGFEDIFRGSEDFVRERQRYYVSLMQGREPVLDVGCEHGVKARGIDVLPEMVEHARQKGHAVARASANQYLMKQPDESLGAVFSAQVIEHMSYDDLLAFLKLAYLKLRPGGILVAETVNPHSISAFKTFWVDPTHIRPIFPEVAVALVRLNGYASAEIVFPNGVGDLERDRYEQGEYALVAERAPVSRTAAIDESQSAESLHDPRQSPDSLPGLAIP
jgi:SAM-dependent methyltransferase